MFNLFRSRGTKRPAASNDHATADDIAFCFRLLLGRSPKPGETDLHNAKIGQDLREVVASFTSSAEFANRGLLMPRLAAGQAADRAASLDDIYFCFRLLLGRMPNAEEWKGHASHVGEDLDSLVTLYANSLEFAQRGVAAQNHVGGITLVQQDGFQIYVAIDDAAVGYHVAYGAYEPDVTAVFRRVLRPGMSVIDIGANIGYFALLSASLVGPTGRVLAIEPNPRNVRMLEASRRANGFAQLTPCQAAAGRKAGLLVLNTAYSNGTTSSISADLDALLGSQTVACLAVDQIVAADQPVDFIKVDVEGAEYNALLGCQRTIASFRPVIVSEFGPGMLQGISGVSGPEYLAFLIGQGYALSVIAPDGSTQATGDDVDAVMRAYTARGTDHIDVMATPA